MTIDRDPLRAGLAAYRQAPVQDTAARRLLGTVWQRVPLALDIYRACLSAGAAVARTGISANALTYASLALSALSAVAAAMGSFAAAAALVLLGAVLDLFDGIVARATGTSSRWGALLDSTVDRVSDGLPLLGLIVFFSARGPLVVIPGLALLGSLVVSYVRARAEALGTTLPPLFMRRPERVILLTLSLLAGLLPCERTQLPAPLTMFGMGLLSVASVVGVVAALRVARGALGDPADGTGAPPMRP